MELSESLEDYLEAILVLSGTKKVVRVKDLMQHLGYKVSSVNNAIKSLTDKGLVDHEKYGYIELTEKGTVLAEQIYAKHKNITRFFQEVLSISKETVSQSACRIEHILTGEVYDKFVDFLNFIIDSPALKEYTAKKMDKSVGAVVYQLKNNQPEYLLVKSARSDFWGLPKGHPENLESETETAIREILEESCYEVKIIPGFREKIKYTLPTGQDKEVIFLLAEPIEINPKHTIDSSEIESVCWINFESAVQLLTYENSRTILDKADKFIQEQLSLNLGLL